MKLVDFMRERFVEGAVPVLYRRSRIGKHIEHEFRWKRHFNSQFADVKVAYNLTDDEHRQCLAIFRTQCANLQLNAS